MNQEQQPCEADPNDKSVEYKMGPIVHNGLTVPDDGKVYWIRGIALPPGSYHLDSGWQSHQGWVEVVTGLLPEERIKVLLFGQYGTLVVGYYFSGTWFNNDTGMIIHKIITHWMYLPDKPINTKH